MSDTGPGDRRTAILRAVWQVIAERGMGAVSVRNVAAAAGVSAGRVQYRFPTKEELLTASLEEMLRGAEKLYDPPSREEAGREAADREALWDLVGRRVSLAEHSRAGVAVFHHYVAAGITHPELARMLAEAKDAEEDEAVRLLAGIAPGCDDPRTAARSLIATADGLVVRVLIGSLSGAEAERALRTELDRIAP